MLINPILAILRGVNDAHLNPLVNCFIASQIDTVEITMNTENAPALITKMKEIGNNHLSIGAGTVLTLHDLDKALCAGAEFIVTPVVNKEVIRKCVHEKIPVFPGAFTPTEIWEAWQLGAEMIKVFPAGALGPRFFKDLSGPLNNVKLMAVGGVNLNTISAFFENGASAVAIGASVFNKKRLDNNSYSEIENDLKALTDIISK